MRRRSRYDWGFVALATWCGLVLVFLLAPVVILIMTSLTAGDTVAFPPSEYSLRWYRQVLRHLANDPELRPGLFESFAFSSRVALLVTAGVTAAGGLAAVALSRHQFRGRAILRQGFLVALIFPQLVTGIALLILFSQVPPIGATTRLILGHMVITLPYVIVTVGASLESVGTELEEAAVGLGASRVRAFLSVTLAQISQGVIAGAVFAFITSFNAFTVSYFLRSGEPAPFPMWMYGYMSYFLDPTVAAISVIPICLTFVALLILDWTIGVRRLASR